MNKLEDISMGYDDLIKNINQTQNDNPFPTIKEVKEGSSDSSKEDLNQLLLSEEESLEEVNSKTKEENKEEK